MNGKDGDRLRPCPKSRILGVVKSGGGGGATTHLSRKVLCSHSLPVSVFPGPVLSRREADTHKRPLSKQGLPSFSTDHIK